MKNILFLFISTFFLLKSCFDILGQEVFAKDTTVSMNEFYSWVINEYGLDQILVNGKYYEDEYRGKVGHPFLFEDQFYKGNLVFREKEYRGLAIKFDVYKQQVVLYINQSNSVTWIIPPNDFISSFSLQNKKFVKFNDEGVPKFYQLIFDTEKLKCLYYWSKLRYDSDHKVDYNSSKFTESKRKTYLLMDDVLLKYSHNNSFLKLFPQSSHVQIKQYLKLNGINVAKCNDEAMEKLLTHCKTLL